MSNTPQQQSELYRKAAETIEMCAKHGIEAKFKYYSVEAFLISPAFDSPLEFYEFPIAVIEGQLVWADTVVYAKTNDCAQRAGDIITNHWEYYTLTLPKQPLCEVEGKPVYIGDMLWLPKYKVAQYVSATGEKKILSWHHGTHQSAL